MKLYRISEDCKGWGSNRKYDFTLKHKWEVPMINCKTFGDIWGDSSIAYPTIDCSKLTNEDDFKKYRRSKRIFLEEFLKLRNQIQHLLSSSLPVPSGTQLGPMLGTTFGQHGDFTWDYSSAVFIHPEALQKLLVAGIKMPTTVKPEIEARGKIPFEHLEIQTEAHALLSERCIKRMRPNCPACDSSGISAFIEPDLITKSSIPKNLDLFRMRIRSRFVLATERFFDAVRSLGLTNIVFEPVEVVDE